MTASPKPPTGEPDFEALAFKASRKTVTHIVSDIEIKFAATFGENMYRLGQQSAPAPAVPSGSLSEVQIEYMRDRFLSWRLPENFSPDGGITFKATFNDHLSPPMKHEPIGTNLFDAGQADAMLRYIVDGLPATPAQPHQEQEVMPDTRGTRQHNATPPATSLAPGAALPDGIMDLVRRLRQIRDHDWRVSFLAHTSDTASEAAEALKRLERERGELDKLCEHLSASQCHAGYAGEYGHHRCREVDAANQRAEQAEAALADALRSNVQFEATLKDAQDFNDTLEAAFATTRAALQRIANLPMLRWHKKPFPILRARRIAMTALGADRETVEQQSHPDNEWEKERALKEQKS